MSYTPADVDLVETAWLDATACGHDMRLDYPEACSRCAARAVLSALAAAGRLLPADAEREWSVRFGDGYVQSPNFTEAGARRTAAERSAEHAEAVFRACGPWLPVPNPEETT